MDVKSLSREQALLWVERNTPLFVINQLMPHSFEDVLTSRMPTLSELPNDRAKDIIEVVLNRTKSLICTPYNLTPEAIRVLRSFILDDYGMLNIEDLLLAVKLGIRGDLTDFFGRLDAQVIMNWLYEYYNLRKQQSALREMRGSTQI